MYKYLFYFVSCGDIFQRFFTSHFFYRKETKLFQTKVLFVNKMNKCMKQKQKVNIT